MLEVDEDSRLGREVIAGGTRYHAHFVPDEEATADFYVAACEQLEANGIAQYEISNFARPGSAVAPQSQILDAPALSGLRRRRSFDAEVGDARGRGGALLHRRRAGKIRCRITRAKNCRIAANALEERFFLGLRLNRGVDLSEVAADFGQQALDNLLTAVYELIGDGLLQRDGNRISLTPRGRLLSNEVFQSFLAAPGVTTHT